MKAMTLKQIAAFCGGHVAPKYGNVLVSGTQSDSRKVSAGDLFIALKGEQVDGHEYLTGAMDAGAAAVLVSRQPETSMPYVLVPDTLLAYGTIAEGYRKTLDTKVVGITGSVGKTTTKEMCACVLERSFRVAKTEANHNNNLGLPMTIMDMPAETSLAVLEMGMNHFGEMSYLTNIAKPDIAVITNIGTSHIEYLGSREGILQAKMEIMRGVPENGCAVFNGDEPLLWNVRSEGKHKKYYFGVENTECDVLAEDIQELEDGMRFVVKGFGHQFELFVPVLGRHTVYNALAAVTVALMLGVKPEIIQMQFSTFRNTGMRQKIYEENGFTIIEDCYNAGPESTEAALCVLESFQGRGRRIAVLGDMLELGNRSAAEHYRIGRLVAQKADMLLVYGQNAQRYVVGAITGGMDARFVEHFDTHAALAATLKNRTKQGDVLLFKGSRGMRMEKALALFLQEDTEE